MENLKIQKPKNHGASHQLHSSKDCKINSKFIIKATM